MGPISLDNFEVRGETITQVLHEILLESKDEASSFTVNELSDVVRTLSKQDQKLTKGTVSSCASKLFQTYHYLAGEYNIEGFWGDRFAFYGFPPRIEDFGGSLISGDYSLEKPITHYFALNQDGSEFVRLSVIEGKMLDLLSTNKNKLVTTEELARVVYGPIKITEVERNNISRYIFNLRKKLNLPKVETLRRAHEGPPGFNILNLKGKAEGSHDPGYIWTDLSSPEGKVHYPNFENFDARTYVVNNSDGVPVILSESEQRLLSILVQNKSRTRNFDEMTIYLLEQDKDIQMPGRPHITWKRLKRKLEPNVSEDNTIFHISIEPKGKGKTFRRRLRGSAD